MAPEENLRRLIKKEEIVVVEEEKEEEKGKIVLFFVSCSGFCKLVKIYFLSFFCSLVNGELE